MPNATGSFVRTGSLLAALALTAIAPIAAQTVSQTARQPAAQASSAIASLRPPAQANRIAASPNFAPQTQLTGHIPAWITPSRQTSASVDLSRPLHLSIVLSRAPAVQSAFDALLAAQQNASSPFYHQWLTPQQVGQLYGPTASDLAAVTGWLAAQGLTVQSIAPSGVIVEVSGSLAAIASAFHTSFGYFTYNGAPRLSAISEPSIPTALAPVITAIHGLTEAPLEPQSQVVPAKLPAKISSAASAARPLGVSGSAASAQPLFTNTYQGSTSYFLTPNDFNTIYDINSIHSAGDTGATIGSNAQHVAIIGRSRVAATDISTFATLVGIASYNLNTIIPPTGTDPGTTGTATVPGDQGEATLDVDRVIGTAPGVQADLVVSASSVSYDGIYIAAAYNVNTLVDPVMTISFGSCEAAAGSSGVNLWNTLFSTAASEGISVFVASGDAGANGCSTPFTPVTTAYPASINYICSSSYATCVGGTEFNDTADPSLYWSSTNGAGLESALSYIPEGAWNEPITTNSSNQTIYVPAASGGGFSTIVAKPSWQTGTGVPADGHRDVPDVAFSASAHDGYLGCLAVSGEDCVSYIAVFSGTSAAAPGMAAIAALLNTKTGFAQGNVNPLLYKLAASTPAAFHDVTVATSGVTSCSTATPSMCNNSTPSSTGLTGGLAGYSVTSGYDEVTGLGSLDAGDFITAAVAATVPSFAFTFPSGASLVFTSGATTGNTESINLASTNGFAGTVNLTCSISGSSAAYPPTCSVAPTAATLTSGGSASATVTISSTAAHAARPTQTQAETRSTLGWRATALSGAGPMLAMLLCLLPVRRRRAFRSLAVLGLLALGIASLSGCSGSSTPSTPPAQSSAGTYTVTITGSGATTGSSTITTATTSFALTID